MVDVCGIWSDEYMTAPLLRYRDERHYWYCDLETIYVAYVSNHVNYGADLSLWPETFIAVVEAYLAKEIAGNLTSGDDKVMMAEKAFAQAMVEARSGDAMRKPTAFPPPGTWTTSRGNGFNSSRWSKGWR
jgi:hypothetical protein